MTQHLYDAGAVAVVPVLKSDKPWCVGWRASKFVCPACAFEHIQAYQNGDERPEPPVRCANACVKYS